MKIKAGQVGSEAPAIPFSQLSRSIQGFDESHKEVNWVPPSFLYVEKAKLAINLTQKNPPKNIYQINLEGMRNKMYLPNNPAARCPGVTEPNTPFAIDCDAILSSLVTILTTLLGWFWLLWRITEMLQ